MMKKVCRPTQWGIRSVGRMRRGESESWGGGNRRKCWGGLRAGIFIAGPTPGQVPGLGETPGRVIRLRGGAKSPSLQPNLTVDALWLEHLHSVPAFRFL